MNTRSTALTRPRSAGGVSIGASVLRTTMLTMSAPARAASANSESTKLRESPKTIVNAPKSATTVNSVLPTRRCSGRVEMTAPTIDRAHPGGRAQQAVADGADVQDVAGEHGQEGGRAAEEHGHQVERDGAQQRPRAEDQADALEHVGEPGLVLADVRHTEAGREERQERGGRRRERGREQVRRRRADRLGDPAQRRPRHHRRLPDRCRRRQPPGPGRAPSTPGGEQGAERGADERVPDPPAEREHVERPDRGVARGRVRGERQRDDRAGHEPRTGDQAPVVAVDHVAGGQRQHDRRDELREPQEPEHERVVLAAERLPAERGRRRSQRKAREQLDEAP